jgi:hypothetical protein
VVVATHAIVDPLAVVVELVDALIANVAVPRILFVDRLTVWAQTLSVIFLHQLIEIQILYFMHMARIPERSSQEKEVYDDELAVDCVAIHLERLEGKHEHF